jgi:hypothetical protein
MVNPKCSHEAVARNLSQRENEAYKTMQKEFNLWQLPEDYTQAEEYHKSRQAWLRARQDVRDFKALHPAAFDFEEVAE